MKTEELKKAVEEIRAAVYEVHDDLVLVVRWGDRQIIIEVMVMNVMDQSTNNRTVLFASPVLTLTPEKVEIVRAIVRAFRVGVASEMVRAELAKRRAEIDQEKPPYYVATMSRCVVVNAASESEARQVGAQALRALLTKQVGHEPTAINVVVVRRAKPHEVDLHSVR
jgi:hypothetical protein